MAAARTPKEVSHPLLWTGVLLGFTAAVSAWFGYMYGRGSEQARNHPLAASTVAAGPAEPDHAALIRGLDDQILAHGREVYGQHCITCHGNDGGEPKPAYQNARNFLNQPMLNGGDPYGMFLTLTRGYQAMPAQRQLSVEDRYAVTHFVRETFIKKNPTEGAYVPVDDEYLASAPWPAAGGAQAGAVSGADKKARPLSNPVWAVMASTAAQAQAAVWTGWAETAETLSPGPTQQAAQRIATLAGHGTAKAWIQAVDASLVADDADRFAHLLEQPTGTRPEPRFALLSKDERAALFTALRNRRMITTTR